MESYNSLLSVGKICQHFFYAEDTGWMLEKIKQITQFHCALFSPLVKICPLSLYRSLNQHKLNKITGIVWSVKDLQKVRAKAEHHPVLVANWIAGASVTYSLSRKKKGNVFTNVFVHIEQTWWYAVSTASPSIKLLVEDPIVVNPGQTVSLVCITTGGEPPPTLTWVSSNDSLPHRSVVKGGTLTLPAITSDEAGVYSCVASNNVGNPAKKSTTIVVRGRKIWLHVKIPSVKSMTKSLSKIIFYYCRLEDQTSDNVPKWCYE